MNFTTVVTVVCWKCEKTINVKVNTSGYHDWKNGQLIQNALPELSRGDRELLISKTCDDCWKTLNIGED